MVQLNGYRISSARSTDYSNTGDHYHDTTLTTEQEILYEGEYRNDDTYYAGIYMEKENAQVESRP